MAVVSSQPRAIEKHPQLAPSQDYAWLRQQGLVHIERMGSKLWTDYNVHDPGITLLEVLCFAITDLGFRTSSSIADLLTPKPSASLEADRQGFFTAQRALTNNPLCVVDLRKSLIDVPGVKNAWFAVSETYPVPMQALCAESRLEYGTIGHHPVTPRGLYEVQIEFGGGVDLRDLGSGKVVRSLSLGPGLFADVELRLPSWHALRDSAGAWAALHATTTQFTGPINVTISGNEEDSSDIHPDDLKRKIKGVLYANLTVGYTDATLSTEGVLTFNDVPLRLWPQSPAAREAVSLSSIKEALSDLSVSGPLGQYRAAVLHVDQVIAAVRTALLEHRNLCEDYHDIAAVRVRDVALCLDLDVTPDADIEAVLAEAYDLIDQYMSPDLKFYSLAELLERGVPVEEVFEGPILNNGFLLTDEVLRTDIKHVLYASDIINLLSNIPGVKSVRNFRMSKYDEQGRVLGPAQAWELLIEPGYAPRFYALATKVLVFKNELPFLPNRAELRDVLQVVRGRRSHPKVGGGQNDIAVPQGRYRDVLDYVPVQFQLPRTYGIGPDGLPPSVGPVRLAQAKQLRGYLLFFEQLLVNYLAQLRHLPELFAIDEGVERTTFTQLIGDDWIAGVESEFYGGLTAESLQDLCESKDQYLRRRNAFLDHLLARFGESFADYSVMLYRKLAGSPEDKPKVRQALVEHKISYLKGVAELTRDRAKAFNYERPIPECSLGSEAELNAATEADNQPGLSRRIRRLLGLGQAADVLVIEHVLLRPYAVGDPLMSICIPKESVQGGECMTCGEEDPYSFRLSIVLSGEAEDEPDHIEWRRYAESVVRFQIPAHLSAKVCWVSTAQLIQLKARWCAWLAEVQRTPQVPDERRLALQALLTLLGDLKSVYPPASLHDCEDGNDANRVYLGRTVITAGPHGDSE